MKEDSGDFIAKMMELGIGLSMVQQMPGMMNGVFAASAASNKAVTPPPIQQGGFYIAVDGKQAGPFTDDEMKRMIEGDLVHNDTLVWKQGMPQWRKAVEVPEVNKMILMKNV